MATLGEHISPAMSSLEFDLHISDYVASVAAAGGLPVQLTRDADVDDMVSRLDGLVLSGGADIEPSRYGAEPSPQLGTTEPDRDEWEFALYRAARAAGIPVLAICRGFQLVNVAHGGTLIQDVTLDQGSGHPQWEVDGHTTTHAMSCRSSSLIARVVGEELQVNSLHHQTVDVVGQGLVVGATAPDGVVESLATLDDMVLAVQWHPELLEKPDPTFRWLVNAAMERTSAAK